MKLQVEMTEGEYERFKAYRAGRKVEDKEGQALAGDLRRLSRAILRAISSGDMTISDESAAGEALKLAGECQYTIWRS